MLALAFDNCSVGWVDDRRKQVRALSEAEAAEARKKQAADRQAAEDRRQPLAYSEIHGLHYEPPKSAPGAARESLRLMREANLFAAQTVMA